MKPVKEARGRLRGHWEKSVSVQCVLLCLDLFLMAGELLLLRLLSMGAEQVVHADELLQIRSLWKHAVVVLGFAAADLLLTSPFRLGQAAFFDAIAGGSPIPVRAIWCYYRRGYARSIRWRLAIWGRRLLWGALCFAPAAGILGYGRILRANGVETPFNDVCRLFCLIFGLFSLAAGWILLELIMLRYMPAQYLIAQGQDVGASLSDARRLVKGKTGEIAWLYIGFSGWLASCLLFVPFFYVSPLFLTTRAVAIRRMRKASRQKPSTEKRVSQRQRLLGRKPFPS